GSSNYGVLITVIIILMIVLVVGVIIFAYIFRKFKKEHALLQSFEEEHLIVVPRLTHQSSVSALTTVEICLWDAVVQRNMELLQHLLKEGFNPSNKETNTPTSPLQEAHLLGDKRITTLFKKHLNIESSTASEDLISFTLKTLEMRISEVFSAAKCGQYQRGVSVLLKKHSLPGTIRNSNGWSLVHYIAAAKFSDGRPAWESTDIRNFFKEQIFYINAIDHWGNTALHILATQEDNKKVLWEGKEHEAKDVWIGMAKLLVEFGCDPRIANHQYLLPHERATNCRNHEMSQYLKEIFDGYKPIKHEACSDKFDDLLNAVKHNHTLEITKHLEEHIPMIMYGKEFLLNEALRSSHAEAVFLLLCAGVEICNCSMEDLTPLEVAHNTIGLPALFPALMRKVMLI
ncbi:unnamed protein product, partial [Meganyctiphanes norvegica]